jgi:hypothetical protein
MALRKIESEQEIQKRQKRTQLIVGIVMVSLLLVSTIGYAILSRDESDSAQTVEYAGKIFVRQNGVWLVKVDDRPFYFFNLPNETADVLVRGLSFSDYLGKPLYIVNLNSAAQRLVLNLEESYLRWQEACLQEGCKENLPLKNCSENVISFVEDSVENTRVEKNGSCVFIYGDFEKGTDAFSYGLLGLS